MRVLRAECAGACYGVQRALDMAHAAADAGARTEGGAAGKDGIGEDAADGASGAAAAYTLGPLIHNPQVVAELDGLGVHAVASVDDLPEAAPATSAPPVVIVRSHGVTPQVKRALEARGLPIRDATCPHVSRAQKAAQRLGRAGLHVVVVGEEGHPEVEALVAYARETGAAVTVVAGAGDLPADVEGPVGIVVQTTQKASVLEEVVRTLRARGIEPRVENTICQATARRQEAARRLAEEVDAMVVIGGRNSSNTTRLAEICAAAGTPTWHVEDADEIDPSWFSGAAAVGVTAGASTPEGQIAQVEARLSAM